MKYTGLDLPSNHCVVSVTDAEDRVVAEKRVPNEWGKILDLAHALASSDGRGGGGIEVQLVLAGRWRASGGLQGTSGEHHGDQPRLGMKNIGKPCAGKSRARFDEGGQV